MVHVKSLTLVPGIEKGLCKHFIIVIVIIPHCKPACGKDSAITPLGINATGASNSLLWWGYTPAREFQVSGQV